MRERQTTELILWPCLFLTIVSFISGCGGGGGQTALPPPTAHLSLAVNPSPLTVSASDSFFVTITAVATNTTAVPAITLGALPAGITTTAQFPMNAPSGQSVTVNFATSSAISVGNISLSISGNAGGATAQVSVPVTIIGAPPEAPTFMAPQWNELQLAQGGTLTIEGELYTGATSDTAIPVYDSILSLTGLPSGVTGTISPSIAEGNQSFTVTLTASMSAPVVQNALFGIIATPEINETSATLYYTMDVTPASGGVGWSNQTSYVPTRATPISAVFDSAHQMIYSANQVWNRVDAISDQTRSIVKTISIEDPRGLDISPDGTKIWIVTGSQVVYSIDTATFQVRRYIVPRFGATASDPGYSWEGAQVLSLADGTSLLMFAGCTGCGSPVGAIWNPTTNTFAQSSGPAPWGAVARSGDGKSVFSFGTDELETSFTYDVTSKRYSSAKSLSQNGYALIATANQDGSMVTVATQGAIPFALYDSNLDFIGLLPGDGGAFSFPAENLIYGGSIFSQDGKTIYEETGVTVIPLILTIDAATQKITSTSPAMPVAPTALGMVPPFYEPIPFAVDSSGMIVGIQYEGISFDDSNVNNNYSSFQTPSTSLTGTPSPFEGPLQGGTTTANFANPFPLTPDVYYSGVRGTALLSSGALSIVSPPAASPGPVDLKILFPDGSEIFDPQAFTYGTTLEDALISGGAPQGGAAAKLDGFGLPLDPSQNTVTVGGKTAAITSTVSQYPPFTGEQSDLYLSYTVPPGSYGWNDITVTTPDGTSTLPKSFYYAKSVTDFPTDDNPTFVLFDAKRNQVYLSAGDHIDVFSLSSQSFSAPLQPPAVGAKKQFQGLALTPDSQYLLATDLTDDSLAVIDPDSPSSSYAVTVASSSVTSGYSCPIGPLFVAADNLGNAYVITGGVIGYGCGPGGYEAIVNLNSKTSALMTAPGCDPFGYGGYVKASGDGTQVAITGIAGFGKFQLYVPHQGTCIPAAAPAQPFGVTFASDGNVIGLLRAFIDPSGNIVGRFAYPEVFYPGFSNSVYYNYSPYQDGALQNPALNDPGSLYFWAYPNYIDVVDVQHGTPSLRLGLTESVTDTVSPMAIDAGGQRIFLITNKGFTVIDLGCAPLSIGHFSPASVGIGSQIQIRGSGFQNGITATLGGVSATVIFTDDETLALTVPSTGTGPQDLVLANPDGTTYTLQNAIVVQ